MGYTRSMYSQLLEAMDVLDHSLLGYQVFVVVQRVGSKTVDLEEWYHTTVPVEHMHG